MASRLRADDSVCDAASARLGWLGKLWKTLELDWETTDFKAGKHRTKVYHHIEIFFAELSLVKNPWWVPILLSVASLEAELKDLQVD